MVDPYRMIYISLLAAFLLSAFLLVYYFIWPRKRIPYPVLIVLVSLLPLASIFRPGSYESGDLTLHTVRFISFYHALQDGVLIPQWSGDLNAGVGEPVFLFVQTLPYHISALFKFVGFSFLDSIKIFFVVAFLSSGIAMYLWAKEEFGKLPGFVAAICYQFAPYHLVDMHFRANPGETLAFTFPPLTMYAIKKFYDTRQRKWFVLSAISTGALIVAHPISLITFPFVILYTLFLFYLDRKKIRELLMSLGSLFIGICLAAYYWLPVLALGKFTHQVYYHKEVVFEHITEYLYSPFRYGLLFQGPYGELSFALGYIQLLFIALALYFLFKRRFTLPEKKYLFFFLIIFTLAFLLMQKFAEPLWNLSSTLRNLQFAYRIMVLEVLLLAAIVGLTAKKIPAKILILICIIAVGSTLLNWGNRRAIASVNDVYLIKELPYSSYLYEGSAPSAPIWTDPKNVWFKEPPKSYLEPINGKAEVKEIFRSSVKHEYVVAVDMPTEFKENTLYFPGWKVEVNNKEHPITYTDKKYPGLIRFKLDKGVHKVTVTYTDTPTQKAAQAISLGSLVLVGVYGLFPRKKSKNKNVKKRK